MTDPAGRRTGSPSPGLVAVVAVLLALPLVALLWVSSYNKEEPRLGGVPFFYWYQFLWVFLAAGCTMLAYRLVVGHKRRREAPGGTDRPARRDGGREEVR